MIYHRQTWPKDVDFSGEVVKMHNFAENRGGTLLNDIKSFFGLSDKRTISLSSNTGKATYKFNGESVLADNVDLQYFGNQDIAIEADKLSGYEFKHWIRKPSITAISKSAEWNYWDKEGEPAADWASFDYTGDMNWDSGSAPLGYASNGTSPVVAGKADPVETMILFGGDAANKYPTAYFRKTIQIEDLDKKSNFIINAAVDDGAIIYINGTEVHRECMWSGEITYNHLAQGYADNPFSVSVPKSVLREGKNVIAVEVHQSMGWDGSKTNLEIPVTSSDIYFQLELVCSDDEESHATVLSTNAKYESFLTTDLLASAIYEASAAAEPKEIYVNEVSGNEKWLEIYNAEDVSVDLSGYILRKIDEAAIVEDWAIPAGTTVGAKGFLVWSQTTDFPYGISADKDVRFKLIDDRKAELDEFVITAGLYSVGGQRTVGRKTDGSPELVIFRNGGTKNASNNNGQEEQGIVKLLSQSLKVYPNPVEDILTIEAESPIKSISISDLSGRTVISTDALRNVKVTIATAKLSKGVYLLTVETEKGKTAKKIVK